MPCCELHVHHCSVHEAHPAITALQCAWYTRFVCSKSRSFWVHSLPHLQLMRRRSMLSYPSLRQWQPRSLQGCSGVLGAYLWWGTLENSTS